MKGLIGCRPSRFLKDTVSGGGRAGRAPGQAEAPRGPHNPGPNPGGQRGARAGTRGVAAPGPFSYLAVREAGRPRVKPGATGRCEESKTLRRPTGTRWLPRTDPRKPLPQFSAPGAGPGRREERGGVGGESGGPWRAGPKRKQQGGATSGGPPQRGPHGQPLWGMGRKGNQDLINPDKIS